MYACPVCKASSVSYFRKWLSYPSLPAHCSACGSYASAHRSSGSAGFVASVFTVTGFGFVASAFQSLWPLGTGIAGALAFYFWHWHRVQLEPLSPEAVSRARKTERMTLVAWLTGFFLS